MERSEKRQLESVRKALHHNLTIVDRLLRTAQPARRMSDSDIKNRVRYICRDIKAKGGSVSRDQLREICAKHQLNFTTVGALYAGGYVKAVGKNVTLTKRGQMAK